MTPAWKLGVQHHAERQAGVGLQRPVGISVPFRHFSGPFQPFVDTAVAVVGTAVAVVGTAVAAFALVVAGAPDSSEHLKQQ